MLKIYYGDLDGEIYNPSLYFDHQYEEEWLEDELAKRMIEDVDKSEVVSAHLIESPVLGPISPRQLSGGVKSLILMAFDDSGKIFNASAGGDNCAKWILEIAKHKDLTITLHNAMSFQNLPIEAEFINDGRYVKNYEEYLDAIIDLRREKNEK